MNRFIVGLLVLRAMGVPCVSRAAEAEAVSLIRLIANPERYHGKRVRVVGHCWLEFEGNALYVATADLQNSVSRNSVALVFDRPLTEEEWKLSGTYVLLEGRFNADGGGHLGAHSGEIRDITRTEPWGQDQAGSTNDAPSVSEAVAPPFFADLCEDSAVIIDLRVEGNGRVSEATLRDAPDVLRRHSAELTETAKRWLFRSRRGSGPAMPNIGFSFRVMPEGTRDDQLTSVFYRDEVQVRRLPCK